MNGCDNQMPSCEGIVVVAGRVGVMMGSANDARRGDLPSDLKMFLFTSCGELILLFGLGRGELFEVRVATAAMVVT